MLLVRWVGTELRVFAYLQNGVLVAAFLGLGLGCRNAREPARLLPAMLALTLVALVVRDPRKWGLGEGITQGLVAFQDSVVWFQVTGEAWPQYVRVSIDDARAFFRKDGGSYDLIWFGLLDSHTTPSAYANVRLDHFVYTRESFADMKRLLPPSGWWCCSSSLRPPGSRTA